MSTFDSPAQETAGTTQYRPRNIPLGIDSKGAHHVYKTHAEAIVVIDPESGTQIHREQLDERLQNHGHTIDVDGWMDTIEEESGWDECWYGAHSGGLLAGIGEVLGGER